MVFSMICCSATMTYISNYVLTDDTWQAQRTSHSKGACRVSCEAEGPGHRHHSAILHRVIGSVILKRESVFLLHWNNSDLIGGCPLFVDLAAIISSLIYIVL
jgi:hypothetical protein